MEVSHCGTRGGGGDAGGVGGDGAGGGRCAIVFTESYGIRGAWDRDRDRKRDRAGDWVRIRASSAGPRPPRRFDGEHCAGISAGVASLCGR